MRFFFENRNDQITAYMSDNLDFGAHLHEQLEIGFIFSGKAMIYIEDKGYELNSGDMFCIFPNQIHRYDGSEELLVCMIIFSAELLPEYTKLFFSQHPAAPVISSGNGCLFRLFDLMFRTEEKLPYETKRGLILAVMGIALNSMRLEKNDRYTTSTLRSILIYCDLHYSEPITINSAADYLHISRSHIAHTMRNKLNTSFGEYINAKRVDRSCELLKKTNMSVTETAFAAGFDSVRTFNRVFAKRMGCSPREFRKE